MPEINKILYPSRIEENNLGDILINALLVRELSISNKVYIKGQPNPQFLELVTKKNEFISNILVIKQIDTNQFFLKTKIQTLFYLLKNRKFYLVFDTPGHISGKKKNIKNLFKSLFEISKILTYKILGIGYVKYGITLGPFTNFFWNFQKIIAKLSFLIVVRDENNADLLLKKGLKNILLKPDLAFLLTNNHILLGEKISYPLIGSITVSLRGSVEGKKLDEVYFKIIIKQAIELIHKLQQTKEVSLINISYQVDADEKTSFLLEDILKREFKNAQVLLHKGILNFKKASSLYQSSEIVITNRLHVFLFAMACKTKSYIVTDVVKHKKIISIAKDIKMDSLIYSNEVIVDWETAIIDDFLITAQNFNEELKNHIATL